MASRSPRVLAPLAFALFALNHCDRAAPEPVATAQAREKARCTKPTPAAAPPPVASGPAPTCPADPDSGPPKVPMGKVKFPGASAGAAIDAEIMVTEANRNRGLMYRRELAEDHGMIFVFDDSDVRTFWMHNTCLPLDMLFVAADGYVTGILENVPTMNDDPRTVPCKAKYVIEVNAGYARRHGVKAGQTVSLEGLP